MRIVYAEWGYEEYWDVAAGLFAKAKPHASTAMCNAFSAVLSRKTVLPVNRATTALVLAVRAFHALHPARRDVIVPAYICPIVVEALHHHNFRTIPADVGDDLNLNLDRLKEAISETTLAVVAAHMYGSPAPIAEIEELCRERGVFLVDDAAQALGVTAGGRPLGTFGDAGMISFSQSKPIAVGFENAGGLVVINNPALEASLRRAWQDLPEASHPRVDMLRFLWHLKWERWTELPTYWFSKLFPPRPSLDHLEAAKVSSLAASIAGGQLASLPERMRGRIRVVEQYQRALAGVEGVRFLQFAPGRYLARIIVSLPPQIDRMTVRNALRKAGVQPRMGYPMYQENAVTPPDTAAALQPTLIELPSHSRMDEAQIAQVVAALKDALRAG